MKKSSVYTRTGDKGVTGLVGGTRIKKNDPRIHMYGEVDELNSTIGFAVSSLKQSVEIEIIQKIQSSLFDLGSNLACEKEKRDQYKLPQIKDSLIEEVEKEIDRMDQSLPELKHFILPGGTAAAAAFHVCRTVCRRVERTMVDFEEANPGEIPEKAIQYVNRLSDYFFILSRYLNHQAQVAEKEWIPN